MSGKIKAVLMDMYGVILKDTGDSLLPFVNETFPEHDFDAVYYYWDRMNVGMIESLELFRGLGYSGDLKAIEKSYLDTIEAFDDFYDFAQSLRKHIKFGLITNDAAEWSRYLREKLDINSHFDTVSVSGELGIKKPDERIFLLTCEKLGVRPEECVYIDDRRKNLYAAEKLGMMPVLFNTRNVPYEGITVTGYYELEALIKENLAE